jgi:hypothetical protein
MLVRLERGRIGSGETAAGPNTARTIAGVISRVHSFVPQGIDAAPCEMEADDCHDETRKTIVGLPAWHRFAPTGRRSRVARMSRLLGRTVSVDEFRAAGPSAPPGTRSRSPRMSTRLG